MKSSEEVRSRGEGLSEAVGVVSLKDEILRTPLDGIPEEEVEAHVERMPDRYWVDATEAEVVWALEIIHRFQHRPRTPAIGGAGACLDWRQQTGTGHTKVIACAWDQRGVLAKIAASFNASQINILRANVYTRSDDLVLGVFDVCDQSSAGVASATRIQQAGFLIEGALSDPPRFASIWHTQRQKELSGEGFRIKPQVRFDNEASIDYTVLKVEAADRIGLLQDVLQALEESGLDIAEALISTDGEIAQDEFHLMHRRGEPVLHPHQQDRIRRNITKAIMV